MKLGLGDFIFYSVLLARAAATHWDSTFVCFLSLLMVRDLVGGGAGGLGAGS